MARIVELGGRRFKSIENGPMKHDIWLMAQVKKAGLTNLQVKQGQAADAVVDEILDRVLETGMALVLLGGLLAPEELELREWTPQVADEVTRWIEGITDKVEKESIRPLIAGMLVGFFKSGLASLTISTASLLMPGDRVVEPGLPNAGV